MALTLDDKPLWVGLVVGFLIAAAAVAAVEYTMVKNLKAEIAEANTKIDELDKKIAQGRAAERKLPQFRDEVKRLQLELDKLRRILPSTRNTEEIIKKVKSLVDQGDFALRRASFPDINTANAADPYVEWPIEINLDGRYHDLAILFNRLGNFSRIMNVENIRIQALPGQETRTITSAFIAKTFVYVEEKDDEKPPEKKNEGPKPGGGGGGTGEE
jgi:type IV pilus assembly protein PilO